MKKWTKRFCRHHKMAITVSEIIIIGWLAMMGTWIFQEYTTNAQTAEAFSQISTTQASQLKKATDQVAADQAQLAAFRAKYPNPTQAQIESYIKTIFGHDAAVAIAISRHECGPWNKDYPSCQHLSSAEDSIGIFQVNLHNSSQWIHAGRIPGATMAEKELWLKNPFNNTLYAFWVYRTSGWTPWSTYTSGAYLK